MGVSVSYCKDEEAPAAESEELETKDSGEASSKAEAKEVEEEEDAAEDSGDDEEEEDALPEVEVKSIPYDPRFPTTNQARNCYTRYNEFYRCKGLKNEEDAECKFYQKAYRSICPGEWVDKWNEQREAGTWQGKY